MRVWTDPLEEQSLQSVAGTPASSPARFVGDFLPLLERFVRLVLDFIDRCLPRSITSPAASLRSCVLLATQPRVCLPEREANRMATPAPTSAPVAQTALIRGAADPLVHSNISRLLVNKLIAWGQQRLHDPTEATKFEVLGHTAWAAR